RYHRWPRHTTKFDPGHSPHRSHVDPKRIDDGEVLLLCPVSSMRVARILHRLFDHHFSTELTFELSQLSFEAGIDRLRQDRATFRTRLLEIVFGLPHCVGDFTAL